MALALLPAPAKALSCRSFPYLEAMSHGHAICSLCPQATLSVRPSTQAASGATKNYEREIREKRRAPIQRANDIANGLPPMIRLSPRFFVLPLIALAVILSLPRGEETVSRVVAAKTTCSTASTACIAAAPSRSIVR